MKKFTVLIAVMLAAVMLMSCGKKKTTYEANTVNPFTDYETLAEAQTAAEVSFAAIPKIDGYETIKYRAAEHEMLEVIYEDEKGNEGLRLRKAKGSADISGVYEEFTDSSEVVFGDFKAQLRGNDGKIKVITWTENVDGTAYSYAVNAADAALDAAAANTLINTISTRLNQPEVTPTPEPTGDTIDGAEIEAGSPLAGYSFKKVNKTCKVKADLLNARRYPMDIAPDAEAVTQLENGEEINVIYESDEWSGFQRDVDGQLMTLWVKSEYLE